MIIIDENGVEIANPNLDVGYLKADVLEVHHEAVEGVAEQWHYKTVTEYSNGGRDVVKVVDVPGVEAREAYIEYVDVYRYVMYTPDELEELEKAPSPLSVEERLGVLEKSLNTPDAYAAGTWYYRGDRVTFEGCVYTCVAPVGVVCVWSPSEYPTYWSKNNA